MKRAILALLLLSLAPATASAAVHVSKAEVAALGPEHAREHAETRELLKNPQVMAQLRAQSTSLPRAHGARSTVGRWGKYFKLPTFGIHQNLLPTGKVLMFAIPFNPTGVRVLDDAHNAGVAYLWNPRKGFKRKAFKSVPPPINPLTGKRVNIWCGGDAQLADGRVLVTGGTLEFEKSEAQYYKGLNQVYTFNPWTEKWARHEDMQHGRWYPTQTKLADGRVLILSGANETGNVRFVNGERRVTNNLQAELFTPWAPRGQEITQLVGTRIPQAQSETNKSAPPEGEAYPHVWQMPSGNVLLAGPNSEDSWELHPPFQRLADWSDIPFDPQTYWSNGGRYAGNGVQLPNSPSKVMLLGGGADATPANSTAIYNESNPSAGWVPGPPWNVGRSHANTVLLPDSSMVTVGGGLGSAGVKGQFATIAAQKRVELLARGSGAWRLGPAQREARAYHSTAMLLPSGAVLSAGDDLNGGTQSDTGELYNPPYLYKGKRPKIKRATSRVRYGGRITVKTNKKVSRVVLMAPSAVTHAVDMNQRHVELVRSGKGWKAPASRNLAPPGYYMLFALRHGVPSTAKWVKLS